MGASLYNKIPLGRRRSLLNLGRVQLAVGVLVVLAVLATVAWAVLRA